jgi:hypothetical protein
VNPVSSNSRSVPPLIEKPKSAARGLRFIFFGQEHTRLRSIATHRELIQRLAGVGGIDSISMVGEGAGPDSRDFRAASALLAPEKIRTVRNANEQEVQIEFARADLCLSFYPRHLLTKSSGVMSAFACGCPVALAAECEMENECFSPEAPVLEVSADSAGRLMVLHRSGELREWGLRAHDWYQKNACWPRIGERIGKALGLEILAPDCIAGR